MGSEPGDAWQDKHYEYVFRLLRGYHDVFISGPRGSGKDAFVRRIVAGRVSQGIVLVITNDEEFWSPMKQNWGWRVVVMPPSSPERWQGYRFGTVICDTGRRAPQFPYPVPALALLEVKGPEVSVGPLFSRLEESPILS